MPNKTTKCLVCGKIYKDICSNKGTKACTVGNKYYGRHVYTKPKVNSPYSRQWNELKAAVSDLLND